INQKDSVVIGNLKIQAARKFSEGLAAIMINGRWGYIDKLGNLVIPAKYIFPANFQQGHAYVMDEELNTYSIDRKGQRLYTQYRIAGNYHDGYAPVKAGFRGDKFDLQENLKMGLIDSTGLIVVEPHFECVREFGSGLAPALVGSDAQELLPLNDDYRTLKNMGGKWGYLNKGGRFGINPQFDDAKRFSEGLAPVKLKGRWGYIDSTGKWIFTPQFKWAGSFHHGIAKVMLDDPHKRPYVGSRALVSKKGVIWIEP
ncbi:MAG: WG repeat-containing protein, partial [Bacteroidia bacterium]